MVESKACLEDFVKIPDFDPPVDQRGGMVEPSNRMSNRLLGGRGGRGGRGGSESEVRKILLRRLDHDDDNDVVMPTTMLYTTN